MYAYLHFPGRLPTAFFWHNQTEGAGRRYAIRKCPPYFTYRSEDTRYLMKELLLAPVGGGKNTGEVKIVERIARANGSRFLPREILISGGIFKRLYSQPGKCTRSYRISCIRLRKEIKNALFHKITYISIQLLLTRL